jgi:nucleotide-binding universal stress UspA family protein
MNIHTILLPIDFQSPPAGLVHQAAAIARQFRSTIVILSVVTPLSYSAGMLQGGYVPAGREDLLAELIRQARKNLDQCLQPELAGLPVKRILVEGDPALEIVKASLNENADLIMMPTHGRKGFRRFLLGSVTAKVLHDSQIPVWTGAHLEDAPPTELAIRNVVCGIDLGPHSRSTASWASQMVEAFHARLTLVHITAGLEIYGPAPEWEGALAGMAEQRIAALLASIGATGDVVIESGDPAKLLNQIVVQRKADLLVVGRSASPGHLGGTGYGIVRESRIPVVSVRYAQNNPDL